MKTWMPSMPRLLLAGAASTGDFVDREDNRRDRRGQRFDRRRDRRH